MGLFNRFKKSLRWEDVKPEEPMYYEWSGKTARGVFTLTESRPAILPIHPNETCFPDNDPSQAVEKWSLVLEFTSFPDLMYEVDYDRAVSCLTPMARETRDGWFLLDGIPPLELKQIADTCLEEA